MAKGAAIVLYHSTAAGNAVPGGSIGQGELALDALASPPHLYTAVPTTRDPSGMIDLLSLSQLGISLPLAVASGGTGAATGNAGFDNLAGVSGNTTGWLNRNAAGQWVLTNPATLFAPINNPANGQNNYAPLANASFTGTTTFPDGSTIVTAGANNGLAGAIYGHQNLTGLGIGYARSGGNAVGGNLLFLGQTNSPCVLFQTSGYVPTASIQYNPTLSGWFDIGLSCYYNGSSWIAGGTDTGMIGWSPNIPALTFFMNTGNTVGAAFAQNSVFSISTGAIVSNVPSVLNFTGSTQLYLGGSGSNTAVSFTTGGGTNFSLAGGAYYNGSNWIASQNTATMFAFNGSQFFWMVNTGLTIGSSFGTTAIMTLTPTVLNCSASALFGGTIQSSEFGTSQLYLGGTNAGTSGGTITSVQVNNLNLASGAYYSSAAGGWVANASNPLILAFNGGSFQFYVDTGKTVGASYTPSMLAQLDSNGFVWNTGAGIRSIGGFFLQGGTIPAGTYWSFGAGGQTNSSTMVVNNTGIWYMRDGNPDWLAWNPTGPAGGNGAYQNISDIRAKTNIASEKRGLEVIKQLNPIIFQRRMPEDKLSKPEIGFLAQDVRPVLPEAVTVVGSVLLDGSGGFDSDEPSLAVTESTILALMVNAIKQLDARLSAMERN